MQGVLHPETLDGMPAVRQWVSYADTARRAAVESHPGADDETLLERVVDYNVMAQVRNLLTFPFVRTLVEKGELEIFGWVYDIASGRVKGLDMTGRRFVPLGDAEMGSPDERRVLTSMESDEEFWERL